MKNIRICSGKVYIEDDRWVTIRGRHVLIKGNNENSNIELGVRRIISPGSKEVKIENYLSRGLQSNKINNLTPDNIDNFDFDATVNSSVHLTNLVYKLNEAGVKYEEVQRLKNQLNEEEIINNVRGRDRTRGSCLSVALAYIGQKMGLDIHDFRGGASRSIIADNCGDIIRICSNENFIECRLAKDSLQSGLDLLKKVQNGREYLLVCGCHASIVRKVNNVLQYLYLQDSHYGGWYNFEDDYNDVEDTLRQTFGCVRGRTAYYNSVLIDTAMMDGDKLRVISGYINTKQKKKAVKRA